MIEPTFLSLEDVLSLHADQLGGLRSIQQARRSQSALPDIQKVRQRIQVPFA